jgi:glycosyltransferase involved in cell wall biosynthesis
LGSASPSLHEGFGIPLLEAMACGTPVVASDTSIFREVAGSAAIYFNLYDPDDVARAIEQCLDKHTGREYRSRSLLQVARYSWDTTSAQTRATYEKALGQHPYRPVVQS